MRGYVTVAHFAPPVPTMLQVDACSPVAAVTPARAQTRLHLARRSRSRVLHEQVGPDDMIALIFSYPSLGPFRSRLQIRPGLRREFPAPAAATRGTRGRRPQRRAASGPGAVTHRLPRRASRGSSAYAARTLERSPSPRPLSVTGARRPDSLEPHPWPASPKGTGEDDRRPARARLPRPGNCLGGRRPVVRGVGAVVGDRVEVGGALGEPGPIERPQPGFRSAERRRSRAASSRSAPSSRSGVW